jgi:archaellum component FlaC
MARSIEELNIELNRVIDKTSSISNDIAKISDDIKTFKDSTNVFINSKNNKLNTQIQGVVIKLAVLSEKLTTIISKVDSNKQVFDEEKKNFVTKDEFKPIKSIVYTMFGTVALAVLWAIISQVLNVNHVHIGPSG